MRGTETLRRRLRKMSNELPEGMQNLPRVLEYDESDPKGPWAGFPTRQEAADWWWKVHRSRVSFVTYNPDGSDDMWGTPVAGEPSFDHWFLG